MNQLLDTYYSLFTDFVRFYAPNLNKCLQLQTFSVIDRYSDLSSIQLNKSIRDYNKPYFYSRSWENNNYNKSKITYDYPALVVFQNSFLKNINPDNELVSTTTYNLEIGVVDTFVQDCLDCRSDYCRDRTHTEIYRDTGHLLDALFAYMQKVKAYNVVTSDGEFLTYKHSSYIKWLEDQGKITSYTIDRGKSHAFDRLWRMSLAGNLQGQWWSGGQDNLRGTFISLQVRSNYCPEYTPKYYDTGSAQLFLDQNCCT